MTYREFQIVAELAGYISEALQNLAEETAADLSDFVRDLPKS